MKQITIQLKTTVPGSQGVVNLRLSPYDIPTRAWARVDDASGQLVITFDYPDHEPPRDVQVSKEILLKVGWYSGKILSLKVALPPTHEGIRVTASLNNLDRALEEHRRNATRYNQQANTDLIKSAISNSRQAFTEAIVN